MINQCNNGGVAFCMMPTTRKSKQMTTKMTMRATMLQSLTCHHWTLDRFQQHIQLLAQSLTGSVDFLNNITDLSQWCDKPPDYLANTHAANITTHLPTTSPTDIAFPGSTLTLSCILISHVLSHNLLTLAHFLLLTKPCISYANCATQQLTHAVPKLVHQCLSMPKDLQYYCQPLLPNTQCKPHTSRSFTSALTRMT